MNRDLYHGLLESQNNWVDLGSSEYPPSLSLNIYNYNNQQKGKDFDDNPQQFECTLLRTNIPFPKARLTDDFPNFPRWDTSVARRVCTIKNQPFM